MDGGAYHSVLSHSFHCKTCVSNIGTFNAIGTNFVTIQILFTKCNYVYEIHQIT